MTTHLPINTRRSSAAIRRVQNLTIAKFRCMITRVEHLAHIMWPIFIRIRTDLKPTLQFKKLEIFCIDILLTVYQVEHGWVTLNVRGRPNASGSLLEMYMQLKRRYRFGLCVFFASSSNVSTNVMSRASASSCCHALHTDFKMSRSAKQTRTESGSWKYIHIGQCVTSIQKQKVTKSKHKSKVGTLKVEKSYHHLQWRCLAVQYLVKNQQQLVKDYKEAHWTHCLTPPANCEDK